MLYALYGSKSLRDTLAETVSWGEKESSLSAKLIINIQGTLFAFTRSKSGAECVGDNGIRVTGQAEVSAYAAELLGADAKVASLLMLASQSGLRGALDDGPAAVSGLMAKLADFDLVDKLLEAANEKLPTGSTANLAQKITDAEEELTAARLSFPDEEQHKVDQAQAAELGAKVETLTASIDTLQDAVTAADEAVEAAENHNNALTLMQSQEATLVNYVAGENAKITVALGEITSAPGAAVIAGLRKDAELEANHAQELAKYKAFAALKYPDVFWDEDEASFQSALALAREKLNEQNNKLAGLRSLVQALGSRRITNGKCPTCGHAANSDEHVAQHNAQIDSELAPANQEIAITNLAIRDCQGILRDMEAVQAAARTFQGSLKACGDRVALDTSVYPAKASWIGEVPSLVPSTKAATALREAEAKQRAADVAAGRHEAAVSAAQRYEAELAKLREKLAATSPVGIEPLKLAHDQAYGRYAESQAALRDTKALLEPVTAALASYSRLVAQAQTRVSQAQARITEYQEDIRRIDFNNALVGKLKKIKPAITDHLWNTVLAAVGAFFSSMRGEHSVVTKDRDGFKVNGKSIESLSGSTLDVLALATRVALTKTFVPHAPFMVLDEPFSACDVDRTGNGLGFIASVGIPQVLMASHDSVSEAIADNVIVLG